MTATLAIPPEQAAREWMDMMRRVKEGMERLQKLSEDDVAIARTPKEAVYQDNKMVLYRYTPQVERPMVGTKDYTEHGFSGGHIGVFVGSKSQKVLAPTIVDWLKARQ